MCAECWTWTRWESEEEAVCAAARSRSVRSSPPFPPTPQPPLRTITFPYGPGGALVPPTCHAWRQGAAPPAEPDVLVGLANGCAVALSLAAQLAPGRTATSPAAAEVLPATVSASGRAVGVAWAPGGGAAVVATASGHVAAHSSPWRPVDATARADEAGTAIAPPPTASPPRRGPVASPPRGASPPRPPPPPRRAAPPGLLAAPGGATSASLSPDGALLATSGADGVLRVHRVSDGALLTGCAAFFGGLATAAWSPDGRCVATGGEDDTALVFGLGERCALGWADGAESWVAAVTFDSAPSAHSADDSRLYRLAVASQDCCIALHDVAVPDDDIAAGLPPLSPRAASGGSAAAAAAAFDAAAAAATAAVTDGGMFCGAGAPPGGLFGGGGGESVAANGGASMPDAPPAGGTPPPPPPPPPVRRRLTPQIAPSPAYADMTRVPAVARACASTEPLCAIAFTRTALVTADAVGGVRVWARPPPRDDRGEAGAAGAVDSGGPPRSAPVAAPAPARRLGAAASSDHLDLMSL